MKERNRRWLSVACMTAMVLGLAACGGQKQSADNGANANATEASAPAQQAEETVKNEVSNEAANVTSGNAEESGVDIEESSAEPMTKDIAKVEATITIAYNEATTPHYDVVQRQDGINLDGIVDEDVWKTVPAISGGFHFPWENREAPVTSFRAFHDGANLYFSFEVTDEDVVVDEAWKEDESTVDNEDRVELFFAQGSIDKPTPDGMPLYYGIEIDPKARVHDYSIEYYRHFDSTWNLKDLTCAATTAGDGYVVEGQVPLQSLEELGLLKNDTMRVGVYRAEFSQPANAGDEPVMEWISWVDPKTENPDFHVDSSFGEFRLLQ